MKSDFDEIKIENFGKEDRVEKFSIKNISQIFKLKNKKTSENFKDKEKSLFKNFFTRKKERKNFIDFTSGYGEFAKLLLLIFSE